MNTSISLLELRRIAESYGDVVNAGYSSMVNGSPLSPKHYITGTDELKSSEELQSDNMKNAVGGVAGLSIGADLVTGANVSRALGGAALNAMKTVAKNPVKTLKAVTYPIRHPLNTLAGVAAADYATNSHGMKHIVHKASDGLKDALVMDKVEDPKWYNVTGKSKNFYRDFHNDVTTNAIDKIERGVDNALTPSWFK